VDDFHSVNYDHIFTTGIGAIQELSKQLQAKDARIASLEEKTGKVEALEHEIAALKKQLASNQQNFDTLEAMVKKLGTVVASKTDR
jgi:predicted RNase H-like nuclease (RuvC/YqgF family)